MMMDPQAQIRINGKQINAIEPHAFDSKSMTPDLQANIAANDKHTTPPDSYLLINCDNYAAVYDKWIS